MRFVNLRRSAIPFLLLLATAAPSPGAEKHEDSLEDFIKANYTKYEFKIPARDGKKLFTAVYVPKDNSRPHAIMLNRTPYSIGPYGVDRYQGNLGPSELFARKKFIFAYQDVRGRYMSEGEFVDIRPVTAGKHPSDVDESTDAYDTIDWLVKNIPNNNGKVGMWGLSYPGFYATAALVNSHPALVAVSPQAPMADAFQGDDCFHHGAFFLASNFNFFRFFTPQTNPTTGDRKHSADLKVPDPYTFFLDLGPLEQSEDKYYHHKNPYWSELLEHTTYDDFWRSRSIDQTLRKVSPAVLTVGGWFDAEDFGGTMKVFRAIDQKSPETSNHIVIGPWPHCGWAGDDGDRLGNVLFNSNTSKFLRESIEFPFFDHYLNGKDIATLPKVWAFETGTNHWRKFDSWPLPGAKSRELYFHADGKLSFEAPTEESADDEYVSDPNRPVPFIGHIAEGVPREFMVEDQRFASQRGDVLVYQTDPLEKDLSIAGTISPHLWASTTGTDCDFIVKVIDVYPTEFPDNSPNPASIRMGGYQQLVRGEPLRAKFRNSLEKPEPMEPGKLTQITFDMPDICHVFRTGHKLMIQVQSSWFPLLDRNPQTFVDIPHAKPSDFQSATQRVSRSRAAPSLIELPLLNAD